MWARPKAAEDMIHTVVEAMNLEQVLDAAQACVVMIDDEVSTPLPLRAGIRLAPRALQAWMFIRQGLTQTRTQTLLQAMASSGGAPAPHKAGDLFNCRYGNPGR